MLEVYLKISIFCQNYILNFKCKNLFIEFIRIYFNVVNNVISYYLLHKAINSIVLPQYYCQGYNHYTNTISDL